MSRFRRLWSSGLRPKFRTGNCYDWARILGHSPNFWPRIYQYMLWDGTHYPSSNFKVVHDIPARELRRYMIYQQWWDSTWYPGSTFGIVHDIPAPMGESRLIVHCKAARQLKLFAAPTNPAGSLVFSQAASTASVADQIHTEVGA